MKFVLNILRRLAALVYAATVFPVAFLAASCITAVLVLLMPVEWIIRGEAEYTAAAILFFISDFTGYIIVIFKIISGD